MSDVAYIYALVDPRTGEMRYVGKANDIDQRVRAHRQSSRYGETRRTQWLRELYAEGLEPVMMPLEAVSSESWRSAEQRWIAGYRSQGFDLVNHTIGGDGVSGHSEQTRAKIGDANRNPGPETRAKMSASHMGKTQSTEARAKIGVASANRVWSPESHAKMSASQKGRTFTAESRALMSASARSRPPVSEETRKRMSDSQTARWVRERDDVL
jgi:predicted GIY-YIG superfamily endonuclease